MEITDKDLGDLQHAKYLLSHPSVFAKITGTLGMPIEFGLKKLPSSIQGKVHEIAEKSLLKAAEGALLTMKDIPSEPPSNIWHQLGVAATGAAGGFIGLPALAVELPLSTAIMMRSILDIARSEGESISSPDAKMAALMVFALGSPDVKCDDEVEMGYYAVRAGLGHATRQAVEALTKGEAITRESANAILRLIALIAEKFGIEVSEKAALQAIPVIGAFGGAVINTVFINHYQDMARGHFTIRRLSRIYGDSAIKALYESLPSMPSAKTLAPSETAGAST